MIKSNIKKIALVSVLSLSAFSANAEIKDVSFPYGEFKEADFENPYLNKMFEEFIFGIQKKDITYNKKIEAYNNEYLEKLTVLTRRGKYKEEEDFQKSIYQLNYKEKARVEEVKSLFYIEELKLFNKFVQNVKSSRRLDAKEKNVMLNSIKPLHKAYANQTKNYKVESSYSITYCYTNPQEIPTGYTAEYINGYCSDLYNKFNKNFALNMKFHTALKMRELVNGYIANISVGDFNENLKRRIEEIKRFEDMRDN